MNQEKERIFLELQAEIRAGLEAYEREQGIFYTKEDLVKRYGL